MKCLFYFLSFLIVTVDFAQPKLAFKQIVQGLSRPVEMVNANDGSGRLFIVEETGKIKIWNGSKILSTPYIDLTDTIKFKGESGLLSIAFSPDYKNNRFFFVYYVNDNNDITIARYKVSLNNANKASQTSGKVLLTIHKNNTNHYGGHLQFGKDGYLYIATGDSGGAGDPENAAQNGKSLLGKFLRIDVSYNKPPFYTIPPDNPYINNTKIRDEIIGLGLRNPFKWSFDRLNGNVWIADVGQDSWEELNFLYYNNRLKKNFGWNCLEGTHAYSACTIQSNNLSPVFEYSHDSTGGFCIIGGYVYRGNRFPDLYGYYLCSDYISSNAWLIKKESTNFYKYKQTYWPAGIVCYGEDEAGELYAATLTGYVYKIEQPKVYSAQTPVARLKSDVFFEENKQSK